MKTTEETTGAGFRRFGAGSVIHGPSTIIGRERISIGRNVHLGSGALIRGDGGLEIGDNTHIARRCVIYTCNHRYEGDRLPYDEQLNLRPVKIGRNVWIGARVTIVPGAQIGDGAVVGAGTVVSGTVPPLAVIGSQTWRVLKYRDRERYQRLESLSAYGGANGAPLSGG